MFLLGGQVYAVRQRMTSVYRLKDRTDREGREDNDNQTGDFNLVFRPRTNLYKVGVHGNVSPIFRPPILDRSSR